MLDIDYNTVPSMHAEGPTKIKRDRITVTIFRRPCTHENVDYRQG